MMTKHEFESRYNEIEKSAESGAMSWKSAMALAALLGTSYGRSEGDAVVKRLDDLILSLEQNYGQKAFEGEDEVSFDGVVDVDMLIMDLQQVRNG